MNNMYKLICILKLICAFEIEKDFEETFSTCISMNSMHANTGTRTQGLHSLVVDIH